MDRCKLSAEDLAILFSALKQKGQTVAATALLLGVSSRTIRDWKRGKYMMPLSAFTFLLKQSGLNDERLRVEYISEQHLRAVAGQQGGRRYIELHGALGTVKDKQKGGYASYKKRKTQEDIFSRKRIILPNESAELAEFIGIMIGDGSIGAYQISVTLDSRTDVLYAEYVSQLINSLFGIPPRTRIREKHHCIVLEVSSASLAEFLVTKGLPCGNKLKAGLRVPAWVRQSPEYFAKCLRGIYDTDGSVFQEKHVIKGTNYDYCRLSLVSASPALIQDVKDGFASLGLQTRQSSSRTLTTRRFTDINKYFRIVGTSNPKHKRRFVEFGGVG